MKFFISFPLLSARKLGFLKHFPLSMFHCSASGCSYFSKLKHGLRTHVSCSHRSSRTPENFVLQTNLHPKLSISSLLFEPGKQLKIDRATDEIHKKCKHFLNATNAAFNADKMTKISFARPDDSEKYNGTDPFEEHSLAIFGATALFGNAYKEFCCFFISLANKWSKNYCNNLLHVSKRNCDVITEFIKKFHLIDTILEHTTKMASKFLADLGFVRESVTFFS